MTPLEHYEEAERLLAEWTETVERTREFTLPIDQTLYMRAQVHATLATCYFPPARVMTTFPALS